MDCRNRRVPGRSKLRQPTEESDGIEAWRADHTRPGCQRGQQSRDQAMRVEQRQHVQQSVLRFKCQGRARVIGRQTDARLGQRDHLRPRRGARRQQDKRVVGAPAANSPPTARARRRADKAERARPFAGSRRQIDDRYAEAMRDTSARRIHVRARQQRRYPQIAEIALPFVGGETRVKRHTDRTSCDRDDRHRSLWSVRQHDRHAITSAYSEASQLANSFVRPDPERAICQRRHGRAPEWQWRSGAIRP